MISFEKIKQMVHYQNGQFTLIDETEFCGYDLVTLKGELDDVTNIEINQTVIFAEGSFYLMDNSSDIDETKAIASISLEENGFYYYLYGPYYRFDGIVVDVSLTEIHLRVSLPTIKYRTTILNSNYFEQCLHELENLFYASYPHITTYDFGPNDIYALNALVKPHPDSLFSHDEINWLNSVEKEYVLFPKVYKDKYQLDQFDKRALLEYYHKHNTNN